MTNLINLYGYAPPRGCWSVRECASMEQAGELAKGQTAYYHVSTIKEGVIYLFLRMEM